MSNKPQKPTNSPPKDVEPVDLFSQIMKMPRAFQKVEASINGQKIPMAIWVLKGQESQLCTIEAEKWTRKLLKENGGVPKDDEKSEGYSNLYESRAAIEILSRACRNPDDVSKPFFMSADQIARNLTTDEIGVLLNQYIIIQQTIGPIISHMESYEMDAWIEVITKGGSVDFLAGTTWGGKSQFIKYLVSQLQNLQMDTSSVTSLLEETSKEDKIM